MTAMKKLVAAAVPAAIACAAFLNARAVSALVGATLSGDAGGASLGAVPLANAASPPRPERVTDASAILDRNPFDHVTGALRRPAEPGAEPRSLDPRDAPPCEGVRAAVVVRAADPDASFAALDVGGRRVLRRRGGDLDGMRVAFVGSDRVWLERAGGDLCQARVFGPDTATPPPAAAPAEAAGDFAKTLAGKVRRVSATELHLDRSAVDLLSTRRPSS